MRFVLVSTHVDQTTGYSKVAYNLLRQASTLVPKVKVYHFGFQRHPSRANIRKVPDGVICYDAAANEDPKEEGFGFNKIQEYLDMVDPDVVMIYNDPLIIHRFIESMKYDKSKSSYKLWIYVDQVYNGIAQPLMDTINKCAHRVYCFTDSWAKTFSEYGGPVPSILEHAVDPTVFSHLPNDARFAARKTLNIPTDAVVFLNANRNSQRKRLDLSVMGFVQLLKRNPTGQYYFLFVTNMNPQTGAYYDLQRIFLEELKLNDLERDKFVQRLMIMDTSPPNTVNDEAINRIYNATDIGVNTSDGEGYGLCQLEHLYTGAPQVVTDVGSYRSFLNEQIAEFIAPVDRVYFPGTMPLGFYTPTFNPLDVAKAFENTITSLAERKKAALDFRFKSWATVCDAWLDDLIQV